MRAIDDVVLHDPRRVAAAEHARRATPALPMPLDAIAGLAARLVGAPMGVITFVDARREHFAGMHGMPPTLTADGGAPLAYSMCKYVVSQNAPVRILDMVGDDDPDLRVHPLAVEYGVRAFAGVPLRDAAGRPVGALSVCDVTPRHWTDAQVSTLTEVARLLEPLPAEDVSDPTTAAALDTASLLDTMQEAFVAVRPDGVVVCFNAAAQDLLGWTAERVYGRPLRETILPDYDGRPVTDALDRLLTAGAGRPVRRRVKVRHQDGHRLPAQVTLSVVRGATGSLICAFITDVSRQEDAEQDAETQRRFLTALLDSLAVGVAACDADGRLVLHNRALLEAHGLPATVAPGHSSDEMSAMLHHPDGTPMRPEHSPLMRAWRGESVRDAEILIQAPGQRSRTFLANSRPITGSDGRRLGAVVAGHEVTGIRRAEAFRDCEQRVLRALSAATTTADAAWPVLQAVATTLGWPHAELWLVDDVSDTLHAVGRWSAPGVQLDDQLFAPTDRGVGITGRVWATNQPHWVPELADTAHLTTEQSLAAARAYARQGLHTMLAVPVHTATATGDGVLGVLACFADTPEYDEDLLIVLLGGVAAQIGQFLGLRRAQQLSRQLTRSRDDFITLVGHEMRTPLTSIATYAALLREDGDALPADAVQMVQAIDRNAGVLRETVDDLLDLAGLESGNLPLACDDIDLAAIVCDAVAAVREAATTNRVNLGIQLAGAVTVYGDPARLRQVVDNLLSNAIKYSPDGGDVQIRMREGHAVVELSVTDDGMGIPDDERGQLFARFYRASNVRHHGIPGTGLGLPLVRTIAQLHGGTVVLDAHHRPGTSIVMRLPRHAEAPDRGEQAG